ncbi:hypothetical protein [Candidatus Pelagibacter sp. HIMB1623]
MNVAVTLPAISIVVAPTVLSNTGVASISKVPTLVEPIALLNVLVAPVT